jgi:hypothetical protein
MIEFLEKIYEGERDLIKLANGLIASEELEDISLENLERNINALTEKLKKDELSTEYAEEITIQLLEIMRHIEQINININHTYHKNQDITTIQSTEARSFQDNMQQVNRHLEELRYRIQNNQFQKDVGHALTEQNQKESLQRMQKSTSGNVTNEQNITNDNRSQNRAEVREDFINLISQIVNNDDYWREKGKKTLFGGHKIPNGITKIKQLLNNPNQDETVKDDNAVIIKLNGICQERLDKAGKKVPFFNTQNSQTNNFYQAVCDAFQTGDLGKLRAIANDMPQPSVSHQGNIQNDDSNNKERRNPIRRYGGHNKL